MRILAHLCFLFTNSYLSVKKDGLSLKPSPSLFEQRLVAESLGDSRYDKPMDFAATYHELNTAWLEKRSSFDKAELSYVANKDTFAGRRLGFMTRAYYQREKMIKASDIFYAYVFQSWNDALGNAQATYPTWLVFSPDSVVNENPAILKEISAKVLSIKKMEVTDKSEKELKKIVGETLSDASCFLLPLTYSLGHYVLLSIVDLPYQHVSSFHLGLNLILANLSISKEVRYLPERYWPAEFITAYHQGLLTL